MCWNLHVSHACPRLEIVGGGEVAQQYGRTVVPKPQGMEIRSDRIAQQDR
jgi:hypothetical protein